MQKNKRSAGFMGVIEIILVMTLMIIGLIVGTITLRDSLTAEIEDTAESVGSLDQSHALDGSQSSDTTAMIAGFSFRDAADPNAGDGLAFGWRDATLNLAKPPLPPPPIPPAP